MAPRKDIRSTRSLGPGYYVNTHWLANSECRTDLQGFLEAGSSLSKDRRALLMAFSTKAVECKRRYRLPDSQRRQRRHQVAAEEILTFTLFPRLPLELRTMIWVRSLPGSRFLELDCIGLENLNRSSDAKTSHHEVLSVA